MSPRSQNLLINAALFCAGLMLWGAALEGASRWWLRNHGDQLDRAMLLLEPDSELIWRQKPYFRGTFEGRPVQTDRLGLRDSGGRGFDAAPKRVLVLGPSSTFGWGVGQQEPYPQQLEKLLAEKYPGAQVLNAGEIGYSAAQGQALYTKRLQNLKPDLIIIAYGANDPDRHRFFGNSPEPDACLLSHEQALKRKLPCLEHRQAAVNIPGFKTLYLASRVSGRLKERFSCPSPQGDGIPPLRQPQNEFRKSLLGLARAASDSGAKILFLTTAHNFPAAPWMQPKTMRQASELQDKARRELELARLPEAFVLLSEAAKLNPYDSGTHYLLSSVLSRQNRCSESRQETAVARKLEQYRLSADYAVYNKIVKEAAQASGAAVLELDKRLSGMNAAEIFIDPIHYSAKGNALVAGAIRDTIVARGLLDGGGQ